MPQPIHRKLLWLYALLVLLAAFGYARYDLYMMDGDGTAFLDIAQYLNTHQAALALNGYWNPGYPAVLALAQRLTHPSLWRELVIVRYTNVLIAALALAATLAFTTALTAARRNAQTAQTRVPHLRDSLTVAKVGFTPPAIPDTALHLLGLALLLLSLSRELPIAAPRADTLLFTLLILAASLALRLLAAPRRLWLYPTLGLTLGFAYLTKSFAFLPSIALLAALAVYALRTPAFRKPADRKPLLTGTLLAAAVFALTAGPYILAISRQLGHLTTGDSARLNFAFFVDLTPRWHEAFHHDLGHATGPLLHPETPLATNPPVFSYAAHPVGTYPLWFDPAWYTLGLKPHPWLHGHLARLARNLVTFARYLLNRPEPFLLLAVLLLTTAAFPNLRRNPAAWFLAPTAWGLLMLLIYLPIDFQDRYLTAPLFLILLPLFAALTARPATTPTTANALILLFAGLILAQSVTYLADRRRHTPPADQQHPGYDPQIFPAAAALHQLGLHPGDKIACMGDLACYTDFYWARLAGAQILGEVETPNQASPLVIWNSIPDKHTVTAPLARLGLRYLVTLFPNSTTKPAGWVQLGNSNFFAYPLQPAP